jgi:hypothetical protein
MVIEKLQTRVIDYQQQDQLDKRRIGSKNRVEDSLTTFSSITVNIFCTI